MTTTKDELIEIGLPCEYATNEGEVGFTRPLTNDELALFKFFFDNPTPKDKMTALSAVVQAHIDQVARKRAYTDGLHCATYANSTIQAWAAEGQAFVAWRDSVWLAAIAVMDDCKAGLRDIPTPGELVAELPVMVWPE